MKRVFEENLLINISIDYFFLRCQALRTTQSVGTSEEQ